MPKDIFDAMTDLEFEAFLPRLEAEVTKFTSIQADKRNSYRKKVREEKKAAKEGGDTAGRAVNGHTADGESPPAKRVRRSSGGASASAAEEDDEADMDEATEGVMDEEDEEGEDDEVEEEDVPEEGLTEDLLEEKENGPSEDDVEDVDMSD
jgi:DNA polymerase epsilon subunit 3